MTLENGATETGIIVPVPVAEPVVGEFRRTMDHSAAWGVPAHVTVLYPFVEPRRVGPGVLAEVGAAIAEVRAFSCTFARVGWFGDEVCWLAPEPDRFFRELTRAVWRRFPEYPPYRGLHPDSTPHLTIGSSPPADTAALRRAASDVRAGLPVTGTVDHACLVAGSAAPGSWRTVAEFPLSG